MSKLTRLESFSRYLFMIRYGVAALLMMVSINYLLSDPTRIIVNSPVFISAVYSITFFSWFFIKRIFPVHNLLFLLWLMIPYVYLALVQFRFNGGVDSSYETLYWLSSLLMIIQGIVWLFSLYPLRLLFQSLENKQQNRILKQYVLKRITRQLALEKQQPDTSYKACMMGLSQLEDLITILPIDDESDVYRMKVIEAMKKHQKTFKSEFTDDYNSARASIGSVIINIEKSWTK